MKKSSLLIYTVLLAMTFVAVPQIFAQDAAPDPAGIAAAAAKAIASQAAFCVNANEKTAEKAVAQIEVLLEAGKPRAACKLAKAAATAISRRSAVSVKRIRHRFARTARVLNRLGAEDLVTRLKDFTQEKIQEISASRIAALESIRAALPDLDDNGDDDSEE